MNLLAADAASASAAHHGSVSRTAAAYGQPQVLLGGGVLPHGAPLQGVPPQPHDTPKNAKGNRNPHPLVHVLMNTRVVRQEQFVIELISWHMQVPQGREETQRLHGS